MTTDTPAPKSDLLEALRDRVLVNDDYTRQLEEAVRTWESLDESPHGLLESNDTVIMSEDTKTLPWPTRPAKPVPETVPFLAELIGVLPDAIVLLDSNGFVKYWNRAAEETFGWMAFEVIGKPPPFLGSNYTSEHNEILDATRRDSPIRERVVTRRAKDGRCSTFSLFAGATQSGDIAMRFRVIEPAKASANPGTATPATSKLEALGHMLASVSHDFNNVLSAIVGSADLLADRIPPFSADREWIDVIRTAGMHATGLTRRLLSFAKPSQPNEAVTDLSEAVEELMPLVKALVPAGVRVKIQAASHLHSTIVEATVIEQIVINLATNAGQAMPRGGVLQIRTSEEAIDGELFVVLAIADTGPGMDDITRSRLFEPYYTTKSSGTGLGLATVRELVQQAGGRITLDSLPGLGSVFRVFFPALGNSREPIGLGKTALIADDDPGVREATKRILESEGFDVSEASTSDEAFQVAKWSRGKIDLLVADVVMPSFGGRRLVERLRVMLPTLPVVMISGYPQPEIADEHMVFLAKPFVGKELRACIQSVMQLPTS